MLPLHAKFDVMRVGAAVVAEAGEAPPSNPAVISVPDSTKALTNLRMPIS
jgi:hypothetical protein